VRRPRIFDQRGRYLGDVPPSLLEDSPSVGASLWEILHPFTVQDEFGAIGKEPPPVSEIIGSAAQNIETHAAAGVENFLSAGKWAVIAVVGLGLLILYSRVKGQG